MSINSSNWRLTSIAICFGVAIGDDDDDVDDVVGDDEVRGDVGFDDDDDGVLDEAVDSDDGHRCDSVRDIGAITTPALARTPPPPPPPSDGDGV